MKRLLLILALVVVATSACQSTEPWAVIVDHEVISSKTVEDEMKSVVDNPNYAPVINATLGGTQATNRLQPNGDNTVNADYTAQIISGRVIAALVRRELASKNLSVSDGVRVRAEQLFREQYPDPATFDSLDPDYRRYLLDRVGGLLTLLDAQTTPEKLQAYYDAHIADFATTCIRHIVVATEEQAKAIRARTSNGEDFAVLAQAESMDTGSAEQGGALGCSTGRELESLTETFREAVRKLSVNEVSEPVQTEYGFHLIQVTSRTQLSFADAQAQVAQTIGDPTTFIAGLIEKADIKVNPRFGEFSSAVDNGGQGAAIQPHHAVTLRDSKALADASELSTTNP